METLFLILREIFHIILFSSCTTLLINEKKNTSPLFQSLPQLYIVITILHSSIQRLDEY